MNFLFAVLVNEKPKIIFVPTTFNFNVPKLNICIVVDILVYIKKQWWGKPIFYFDEKHRKWRIKTFQHCHSSWNVRNFSFLEDWHDQMSDICFVRLESNHFPTMDVIRHLKIKHFENLKMIFGILLEEMGFVEQCSRNVDILVRSVNSLKCNIHATIREIFVFQKFNKFQLSKHLKDNF